MNTFTHKELKYQIKIVRNLFSAFGPTTSTNHKDRQNEK
jgi:hypothetical protein